MTMEPLHEDLRHRRRMIATYHTRAIGLWYALCAVLKIAINRALNPSHGSLYRLSDHDHGLPDREISIAGYYADQTLFWRTELALRDL